MASSGIRRLATVAGPTSQTLCNHKKTVSTLLDQNANLGAKLCNVRPLESFESDNLQLFWQFLENWAHMGLLMGVL